MSNADPVASAAAVISLCALLLSFWEGYHTRQHNRLLVQPLLAFGDVISSDSKSGISVTNKGIGPAVIQRFAVVVDDVVMESDDYGGWKNALHNLGLFESWIHYYKPDNGDAISPGDSLWLLRVDATVASDRKCLNRLKDAMARTKILIVYTSLYDEPQTAIYRKTGALYEKGASNAYLPA